MVGPGRELVDPAGGMSVDQAGEGTGEISLRVDRIELAGFDERLSDAMTAQWTPPWSEPANSAFLRLSAIGRIERSTTLESISTRPSSTKTVRPAQCLSA